MDDLNAKLEKLYKEGNGDYHGVLGRMRTPERVAKFLGFFAQDPSYETLRTSVESADWDNAFRAAHTLKGVASDMGFAELSTAASNVTEEFRAQRYDEGVLLMPLVDEYYKLAADAIAANL